MGHPDYNLLAKLGQLPENQKRNYEMALLEVEALKEKVIELTKEVESLKEKKRGRPPKE